MRKRGDKSFCIWGEGPDPFPGLAISSTVNIDDGRFESETWEVADGVDCPVSTDGRWLLPLGEDSQEIKLEAGAHPVQLSTGDWLFFYAAATPGWVPNGNYTAGFLVLDRNNPTRVIQRMSGQWLTPKFEYETLCNGVPTCKYTGERKNVIFLSSATPMAAQDTFRLFFGGGDGNVGTAVVRVEYQ